MTGSDATLGLPLDSGLDSVFTFPGSVPVHLDHGSAPGPVRGTGATLDDARIGYRGNGLATKLNR